MSPFVVLAVDDDPVQLQIIISAAEKLEYPPFIILTADSVSSALHHVENRILDLVICDYLLPDGTGVQVLDAVRARTPLTKVIMITAHESATEAVTLMKKGASDYLVKPLKPTEVQQMIAVSLEWCETGLEIGDVSGKWPEQEIMISLSNSMKTVLRDAVRAASSEVSILIQGESGTGKDLLARTIHERSNRRDKPFIPVHMAALPESLMESELFGHRRGAFTGAAEDRKGVFEEANGGTLFIDELGEIPLNIQVKLLRAIQFHQIQRVGESQVRALDVRFISATNRDLETMVAEKTFRDDLYYRINVVSLRLPPLRERREDIPRLVEKMITELARKNGRPVEAISQRALNCLISYGFPGNVRELENILERAIVLAHRTVLTEEDLPPFVIANGSAAPVPGSLDEKLQALERTLILDALELTQGHQSHAASLLDITERRLRSRMQRLKITNPF